MESQNTLRHQLVAKIDKKQQIGSRKGKFFLNFKLGEGLYFLKKKKKDINEKALKRTFEHTHTHTKKLSKSAIPFKRKTGGSRVHFENCKPRQ